MAAADQEIAIKVDYLKSLDRSDLVDMWVKAYGAPPFKGVRNGTLVRGLAYHIQGKQLGGLKPRISRQLHKIARPGVVTPVNMKRPTAKPKAKLGSQLIREWNGRTHNVHVTDKGFVLSGVTYSSLSAAAKAITGTHQSGPRFFGVRG